MKKCVLSLALVLILIFGLAACGGKVPPVESLPVGGLIPGADGTQVADTIPPATEALAPALPAPKGADSVKTLLEKVLEYLHSGCDYSKIEDVHDPVAYLAYFIMEDFYRDENLSFAQAREKAALLYGDAETLKAKDPELAELVMEEMDAEDPEEALNEYMNNLRNAFRNGDITEENPNYDKLSALLTDWDKGADYIFEHYPELMEDAQAHGAVFGLEGAMEQLRKYARFELYNNDLLHFQTLECEYRPENTFVNEAGWCSYDMGYLIEDGSSWGIDMLYYVENETYYLMGFSTVVGGVGG